MECGYCKKEFKKNTASKECSLKCRLLKKMIKEGECWMWKGSNFGGGYGVLSHKGKMTYAHRLSYLAFKGEIPKGMFVCHNCPGGDKKSCINPDHLWIGSRKDNINDASKKGRLKGNLGRKLSEEHKKKWCYSPRIYHKGENHGRSKLKENEVKEIKRLIESGIKYKKISFLYGISTSTISNINTKRLWSHV